MIRTCSGDNANGTLYLLGIRGRRYPKRLGITQYRDNDNDVRLKGDDGVTQAQDTATLRVRERERARERKGYFRKSENGIKRGVGLFELGLFSGFSLQCAYLKFPSAGMECRE
jgi:hypothetical protein